jgi:hypothetical protein
MSTLKVNTLTDTAATKSVPIEDVVNGVARAWVNFDGTGTVSIRASYNVSSITDNGTGDYTVNFTTAMPDANYCVNVSAPTSLAANHSVMAKILGTNAGAGADLQSTTQIRVVMTNMASTAVYADVNGYCVAIFR